MNCCSQKKQRIRFWLLFQVQFYIRLRSRCVVVIIRLFMLLDDTAPRRWGSDQGFAFAAKLPLQANAGRQLRSIRRISDRNLWSSRHHPREKRPSSKVYAHSRSCPLFRTQWAHTYTLAYILELWKRTRATGRISSFCPLLLHQSMSIVHLPAVQNSP